MTELRKNAFEYDGHRFETVEHASHHGLSDAHVRWEILMDGHVVLEFAGPFRYRDHDVKKRVVEWYEIQKPIPRTDER